MSHLNTNSGFVLTLWWPPWFLILLLKILLKHFSIPLPLKNYGMRIMVWAWRGFLTSSISIARRDKFYIDLRRISSVVQYYTKLKKNCGMYLLPKASSALYLWGWEMYFWYWFIKSFNVFLWVWMIPMTMS